MVHTYDEAVAYLKSFIPFTLYQTDAYQKNQLADPLGRMKQLLQLLAHPEKKFTSILVGGTSGKGSTSYLIAHILTTAGYKTGLTVSPHLVRINERIQINTRDISDEDFVALVQKIQPVVEQMKHTVYGVPSYFEITIAMAFLYFAKQKVDIAVVEVGMGGEHDATNTLDPLIAVVTNVSLDHTQFLGDTVEKIAQTKVGIIKGNVVITAVTQPSVISIVEDQCHKVGATVFRLGKDFFLTEEKIGLQAFYQKENASLAIQAIKQLQHWKFVITDAQIKHALATATFPGRFEIKEVTSENKKVKIILDGAHNPAKMHAFVTSLQKAFPKEKKIFVIACKKDKNIEAMIEEMLPVADVVVVTEFSIGTDTMISNASYDAEQLKNILSQQKFKGEVYLEKDSLTAVEKATSLADDKTIIAITGSLYLIGELQQRWNTENFLTLT